MAVTVVVHPGGAGAELLDSPQTRLLRDVGEGAIAVVAKKPALAQRGDKQVVVAVVVVIAHGHAHAVHLDR